MRVNRNIKTIDHTIGARCKEDSLIMNLCHPNAEEAVSYYKVNRAGIGGIKVYVKHWLPESRRGIIKPPMIGISDGSNFLDFQNAEDLSNYIWEINANQAIQSNGINLPIEAVEEITIALTSL